jgi:hypothetical protein
MEQSVKLALYYSIPSCVRLIGRESMLYIYMHHSNQLSKLVDML